MNSAQPPHTMRLLAVVVTTHNLEHYIGDCLASIASQSTDEIEVIVVDDGSTDLTVPQIEAAMRAHPHCAIRLIAQDNRGVSEARNRGIAAACAHYLAFIDGDDMWTPDFCDRILPILRDGHSDMIEFDVEVIDDRGTPVDKIAVVATPRTGSIPIDTVVLREFVDVYQAFVWARVYRATLWRNLRFPSGRHYEDNATVPYLYLLAHTLYRIDRPLYRYRRRNGSITSLASLSTVRDLALNAEEALVRSGDTVHGEFWRGMFLKSFRHVCSQAARVDVGHYPAALDIVAHVIRRFRHSGGVAGRAADYRTLRSYAAHIRFERTVFRIKRAIKRVLGREVKARPKLCKNDALQGTKQASMRS